MSVLAPIGAGLATVAGLTMVTLFGVAAGGLLYGMVMDILCRAGYVDDDIKTYTISGGLEHRTLRGSLMEIGFVANAILAILTVLYVVGLVAIELGVVQT